MVSAVEMVVDSVVEVVDSEVDTAQAAAVVVELVDTHLECQQQSNRATTRTVDTSTKKIFLSPQTQPKL